MEEYDFEKIKNSINEIDIKISNLQKERKKYAKMLSQICNHPEINYFYQEKNKRVYSCTKCKLKEGYDDHLSEIYNQRQLNEYNSFNNIIKLFKKNIEYY